MLSNEFDKSENVANNNIDTEHLMQTQPVSANSSSRQPVDFDNPTIKTIEEAGEVLPPAESNLINQICLISCSAVLGTYLRIILTDATPEGFVTYLTSQFMGSFVLGFVFNIKDHMNTDIFAGISVGFCGSLTTFSSWQADIVENLVGVPGSPASAAGKTYSWFQDQCIGFAVPFAGLTFGKHTSDLLSTQVSKVLADFSRSAKRDTREKGLQAVSITLTLGTFAGVIVGVVLAGGILTYALIFAPAGALLRFGLSRYLNTLTLNFYWGTFVANVLGSVVLAILFAVSVRNRYSTLGCSAIWGAEFGFCGSLTTVSTFVNEIHAMPQVKHAYVYGVTSILVTQALLIIIMGSVVWTMDDPFADASVCYISK